VSRVPDRPRSAPAGFPALPPRIASPVPRRNPLPLVFRPRLLERLRNTCGLRVTSCLPLCFDFGLWLFAGFPFSFLLLCFRLPFRFGLWFSAGFPLFPSFAFLFPSFPLLLFSLFFFFLFSLFCFCFFFFSFCFLFFVFFCLLSFSSSFSFSCFLLSFVFLFFLFFLFFFFLFSLFCFLLFSFVFLFFLFFSFLLSFLVFVFVFRDWLSIVSPFSFVAFCWPLFRLWLFAGFRVCGFFVASVFVAFCWPPVFVCGLFVAFVFGRSFAGFRAGGFLLAFGFFRLWLSIGLRKPAESQSPKSKASKRQTGNHNTPGSDRRTRPARLLSVRCSEVKGVFRKLPRPLSCAPFT
jgi:hypothetical protein